MSETDTLVPVPSKLDRLAAREAYLAKRAEREAEKAAKAAAKKQPPGRLVKAVSKPQIDAAWHTDPDTPAPRWTKELDATWLQALYDGKGSRKHACQKTGVPYRALLLRLESDPVFAERAALVERIYQDRVYEEFQDRVLTDPARPANIIFQMKSRDARYAEVRKPERVTFNIAITDPTFGAKGAAKVIETTAQKVLSA
jgi:hypothetical protein